MSLHTSEAKHAGDVDLSQPPFGASEADAFFHLAIRLPDDADFQAACEGFCRGNWGELAFRLGGCHLPQWCLGLNPDLGSCPSSRPLFPPRLRSASTRSAVILRILLKIGLLANRWGANVDGTAGLEAVLYLECDRLGVAGVTSIINDWLFPKNGLGLAELTAGIVL